MSGTIMVDAGPGPANPPPENKQVLLYPKDGTPVSGPPFRGYRQILNNGYVNCAAVLGKDKRSMYVHDGWVASWAELPDGYDDPATITADKPAADKPAGDDAAVTVREALAQLSNQDEWLVRDHITALRGEIERAAAEGLTQRNIWTTRVAELEEQRDRMAGVLYRLVAWSEVRGNKIAPTITDDAREELVKIPTSTFIHIMKDKP